MHDCTLRSKLPGAMIPVNAVDIEEKSGWDGKPSNVFVSLRINSNFSSILDEMGKNAKLFYPVLTCTKLTIETLEKRYEICSKLTMKIPERRYWRLSGVFIVNLEHISHRLGCCILF